MRDGIRTIQEGQCIRFPNTWSPIKSFTNGGGVGVSSYFGGDDVESTHLFHSAGQTVHQLQRDEDLDGGRRCACSNFSTGHGSLHSAANISPLACGNQERHEPLLAPEPWLMRLRFVLSHVARSGT